MLPLSRAAPATLPHRLAQAFTALSRGGARLGFSPSGPQRTQFPVQARGAPRAENYSLRSLLSEEPWLLSACPHPCTRAHLAPSPCFSVTSFSACPLQSKQARDKGLRLPVFSRQGSCCMRLNRSRGQAPLALPWRCFLYLLPFWISTPSCTPHPRCWSLFRPPSCLCSLFSYFSHFSLSFPP